MANHFSNDRPSGGPILGTFRKIPPEDSSFFRGEYTDFSDFFSPNFPFFRRSRLLGSTPFFCPPPFWPPCRPGFAAQGEIFFPTFFRPSKEARKVPFSPFFLRQFSNFSKIRPDRFPRFPGFPELAFSQISPDRQTRSQTRSQTCPRPVPNQPQTGFPQF